MHLRVPVMFHVPRLIALRATRGETGYREIFAAEYKREIIMRHACTRTLSPRAFLLLEHSM